MWYTKVCIRVIVWLVGCLPADEPHLSPHRVARGCRWLAAQFTTQQVILTVSVLKPGSHGSENSKADKWTNEQIAGHMLIL